MLHFNRSTYSYSICNYDEFLYKNGSFERWFDAHLKVVFNKNCGLKIPLCPWIEITAFQIDKEHPISSEEFYRFHHCYNIPFERKIALHIWGHVCSLNAYSSISVVQWYRSCSTFCFGRIHSMCCCLCVRSTHDEMKQLEAHKTAMNVYLWCQYVHQTANGQRRLCVEETTQSHTHTVANTHTDTHSWDNCHLGGKLSCAITAQTKGSDANCPYQYVTSSSSIALANVL